MERIREILRRRTPELRGFLAPQSDIDRLASLTTATRFAEIVEVYREFPVCGMTLQFVVDKVGCTNPPGPLFMDPYDPETEFEFTWISPMTCSPRLDPVLMRVLTARMGKEILDEAEATWPGADHRQAA